jgi:hypothetical protein
MSNAQANAAGLVPAIRSGNVDVLRLAAPALAAMGSSRSGRAVG